MVSKLNKHKPVSAGLSCNLDTDLLQASIPLFQTNMVDVVEWSFDTLYKYDVIPDWFTNLLLEYSKANRLVGHGVYFSMFLGKWSEDQAQWLKTLAHYSKTFQFDHISEHFGFLTGKDFHTGAPLPVPLTAATLAIGRDRLLRLFDTCQCPVGVENLAFSFTLDAVKKQGEFLNQLVEPVNGFIILDLHNLYCQVHNFKVDFDFLVSQYPLEKVREIHISGGSWQPAYTDSQKKIRRDTHDAAVPDEVFDYLPVLLSKCPNLKYVILEQLGRGFSTPSSIVQFQQDFKKLTDLITELPDRKVTKIKADFLPNLPRLTGKPIDDEILYAQQVELSEIVENCADVEDAILKLNQSTLANSAWRVEQWGDDMLDTAIKIAKKWKDGFS